MGNAARRNVTCGMQNGITKSMKTAISVDDQLMGEADQVARQMGLSRSGLVSRALEDFLRARRGDALTAKLNQVYAAIDETEAPAAPLDPSRGGNRDGNRDANLVPLLARKFKRSLKLGNSW
jgi:predicted transcriptional regulator